MSEAAGRRGAALRVGRILERSCANGPGERFVVWAQGCSLRCPGCFNPGLQDPGAGLELDPRDLASTINAQAGIRGVTFSGGEPLEQPEAVARLLGSLDRRLDVVLFTGYSWDEVLSEPGRARAALRADLVAAGRLHLYAVVLLAPYLTSDNHESLLGKACRRTTRELQALIAGMDPGSSRRDVIRVVSAPSPAPGLAPGPAPLSLGSTSHSDAEASALPSAPEALDALPALPRRALRRGAPHGPLRPGDRFSQRGHRHDLEPRGPLRELDRILGAPGPSRGPWSGWW